jgi:hypothetical protein
MFRIGRLWPWSPGQRFDHLPIEKSVKSRAASEETDRELCASPVVTPLLCAEGGDTYCDGIKNIYIYRLLGHSGSRSTWGLETRAGPTRLNSESAVSLKIFD